MKNLKTTLMLTVALFMATTSCKKDNTSDPVTPTASFTMTFQGKTYTNADIVSLGLVGGNLTVLSNPKNEFWLSISGVGADGSTTNICTDFEACGDNMCVVSLSFNSDGLAATSGTVKRTGNRIEINVLGTTPASTSPADTYPLTATIVVGTVLDF